MTLANLKKHNAYLRWLASGEFTERDFDYKIEASDNPHGKKGEPGRMTMGDFTKSRRHLIQEDAQRTLKVFLRKYPEFVVKEETPSELVNVETPAVDEPVVEGVDYSSMTVAELKVALDAAGVVYNSEALKTDLLKLCEGL